MLRNCHCTPGFENGHREANLAGGSAQWAAAWSIAANMRSIGEAWREGLAAHREYERLTSRGMAHDIALREALGIGPVSSPSPRDAAKPLCFAGKA
jgi:hypothetical protein